MCSIAALAGSICSPRTKTSPHSAFERAMAYALEETSVDLLSYCLMSNHWHLLLRPAGDKSFPVQEDMHFLAVARYIERNALRARRVKRAENWRWSSLWRRLNPAGDANRPNLALAQWPVPLPSDWVARVNQPHTAAELEALHVSVNKGRPYGGARWQAVVTRKLGLESSFREPGRPKRKARGGK